MPPDNMLSVAPGADVEFPRDGPNSGTIMRMGPSSISLSDVGVYRVSFSVPVNEWGQLVVTLDGVELPYTVVGRPTGSTPISGEALIRTTQPGSVLTIRNPLGAPTALTITPLAGGAYASAATLVVEQLR